MPAFLGTPRWCVWGIAAWSLAWLAASAIFGQGLERLTQWEAGRSMRAGSNVWIEEDPFDGKNNQDRPDRIEAGETYVMADLEGPGVITHIWPEPGREFDPAARAPPAREGLWLRPGQGLAQGTNGLRVTRRVRPAQVSAVALGLKRLWGL